MQNWDCSDICVVFTWKFLPKINNRFGFRPGVSIVIIAKEVRLPQKQWGAKELCNLRGKSWSNRKHRWMIWVILSLENSYSLRKGYLPAAPLILHTTIKRLASLSNRVWCNFKSRLTKGFFQQKQIINTWGLLTEPLHDYFHVTRKLW